MVIIDMFGKINDYIISHKLNLKISNLDSDWVVGIQEDIIDELNIRKIDSKKYYEIKKSSLESIIGNNYYKSVFNLQSSELENVVEIAENLVCIYVCELEKSVLGLKNQAICNPTCEKEFEDKLLKFMNYILKEEKNANQVHINQIYNSSLSVSFRPVIIQSIQMKAFFPKRSINHKYDFEIKLEKLKRFGVILDNYIEDEYDFHKLDYLINTVYEDNEYNAFHLMKLITIIDMLIINPKKGGKLKSEMRKKLPQFLNDEKFDSYEMKIEFADLVRIIRNKIAHGDFRGLSEKLEEYASKYMKHFWFDYYEYSRENWIYLNLCCELDEIISKIIYKEILYKSEMKCIRNS